MWDDDGKGADTYIVQELNIPSRNVMMWNGTVLCSSVGGARRQLMGLRASMDDQVVVVYDV